MKGFDFSAVEKAVIKVRLCEIKALDGLVKVMLKNYENNSKTQSNY